MALPAASELPTAFWTLSVDAVSAGLNCGTDGLAQAEAAARLDRYGRNLDKAPRRDNAARALVRRLLEPLALVLLAAAVVSGVSGDVSGAVIIALILGLSIGLDTLQEHQALRAAEMLRRSVAVRTEARRDGEFVDVQAEDLVPGDVIRVRCGDVVPADALVLRSDGFAASEAALTGEPYPVEKRPGPIASQEPAEAASALFRGAVAQTGEAVALVVATGRSTLFGQAASALAEDSAPSPFQRDLRSLGFLIVRLTAVLVVVVLGSQMLYGRPFGQSLLFAVALAVGLTPELLPMITTVTLARGAVRLAAHKVIVKRLASIHDMGAMTILCTDKTGTLTSAEIRLSTTADPAGQPSARPAELAAVCALLGGDRSALDEALKLAAPQAAQGWSLLDRRSFDFQRRLGSVIVQGADGAMLIVKGAPEAVLPLCSRFRQGAEAGEADTAVRDRAIAQVHAWAEQGLRSVAIASKPEPAPLGRSARPEEDDLVYEGLCAFADPPKPTAGAAIARLAAAKVKVKILSGDHPAVVGRLCGLVGLRAQRVLTGPDIAELSADALKVQARKVDAFARLTPDQKARIIRALQAGGEVVGFLGDGVNDAPGLKAADIGLSVEGASGVAREAADMILLQSDLEVVADGVIEGRRTFANILKYVRMGASSNFGNMLSMAAASMLLPFLPMLPTQVLLNNLLYDVSEIGLPLDDVSPAETAGPQHWSLTSLVRFAGVMGPLSSVFDLLTFAGLFWLFRQTPERFRTAWFLESMATQILVIFLIRTRGAFWRSRPHPALVISSLGALAVALALPFTPLAPILGFQAPAPPVLLALGAVVLAYLISAELLKRWAIPRQGSAPASRSRRKARLRSA